MDDWIQSYFVPNGGYYLLPNNSAEALDRYRAVIGSVDFASLLPFEQGYLCRYCGTKFSASACINCGAECQTACRLIGHLLSPSGMYPVYG